MTSGVLVSDVLHVGGLLLVAGGNWGGVPLKDSFGVGPKPKVGFRSTIREHRLRIKYNPHSLEQSEKWNAR